MWLFGYHSRDCSSLDYGTSFGGTAITSTVRVADKPYTKTIAQESVIRYVHLFGKALGTSTGSPQVTFKYYGDTDTTGVTVGDKPATHSGYRLYHNIWQINKKCNIHSYEFTITNAYNIHHFEPFLLSILYKGDRIEVRGD